MQAEIPEYSEESNYWESANESAKKGSKKRNKSDMMHRNYSKDENSDAFKQKSTFDIEEDALFFQYNSDGQAQNMHTDDKSESITTIKLPKKPTLKKVRSDSLTGSNYKDSCSKFNMNGNDSDALSSNQPP